MPETREEGKQEVLKKKSPKSVQFNLADNKTVLLEGTEHGQTGGNAAINGSPDGDHLNDSEPEGSNSAMPMEVDKLNEELKTLRDKLEGEVEELRREVNYKRKTYLAQSKELDALVEEERRRREENLQDIKTGFDSKVKDRQQRCNELDNELTAKETDIDERTRSLGERETVLGQKEAEVERRVEQCEANDNQVSDWEKELVTRKQKCEEFQRELDDVERYLDKRQAMCNSKDDDLKMLDEELTRLRTELQKNRDMMEEDAVEENAEVIHRLRRLSTTSPSVVVGESSGTRKGSNTVLHAVVRKLQHDLQETEHIVEQRDQEISELERKVLSMETELQKKDQKVKQLEAQLTISLGEIRRKESTERKEPSHRKHHDRSTPDTKTGTDNPLSLGQSESGPWGLEAVRSRSSSQRYQVGTEETGHRSDKSSSSSGSRHSIMKEYDMANSKACSVM